jgi:hypothetical protein
MFNLGHNYINSVTVTDRHRRVFNKTEIHGYTTVSFVEGEGLPNLLVAYFPSVFAFALLFM